MEDNLNNVAVDIIDGYVCINVIDNYVCDNVIDNVWENTWYDIEDNVRVNVHAKLSSFDIWKNIDNLVRCNVCNNVDNNVRDYVRLWGERNFDKTYSDTK